MIGVVRGHQQYTKLTDRFNGVLMTTELELAGSHNSIALDFPTTGSRGNSERRKPARLPGVLWYYTTSADHGAGSRRRRDC